MIAPTVNSAEAGLEERPEKSGTRGTVPRWVYTLAVSVIALILLIPVFVTIVLAFQPQAQSSSHSAFTFENFSYVFSQTAVLTCCEIA